MADANPDHRATQFLRALRQHVLDPLATADRMLATERSEVKAELDAFEAFAERLAAIDPVAEPSGPDTSRPVVGTDPSGGHLERVRAAYRETVGSVAHYEDVYGKTVIEDVAAEFGDEIATGLQPATSISFTQTYKSGVQAATGHAIQLRQVYLDTLDREATSIDTARDDLAELVGHLDTTTVPEWYRDTFREDLDLLARDRQETIRTRRPGPRYENHALCEHLYADAPWTFPVLTGVARVREAIEL